METQTPKEFFEKALPARFKPEKAAGIDVVVQIYLIGASESEWVVAIKNQKLDIKQGTTASPTLKIKMTEKDFMDLVSEKISVEKAFFSGKIHFEGNLNLALKLKDAGFL